MNLLRISIPLLPTPMQPIAMRLLGAFWPKTDAGTIVGAASATAAADFTKSRRETREARGPAKTQASDLRRSIGGMSHQNSLRIRPGSIRRNQLHRPQIHRLPVCSHGHTSKSYTPRRESVTRPAVVSAYLP